MENHTTINILNEQSVDNKSYLPLYHIHNIEKNNNIINNCCIQ